MIRQGNEVFVPIARIDANSNSVRNVLAGPDDLIDQGRQECCRQIVDAVVAEIFENVECNTFPGSRQPTDDN
jgi:hypothetical protein